MCEKLKQVERGEIKRMMLFMPPRHSKSMTVAETFPSYFIGRNPRRRVIAVSYSGALAYRFGRANRSKLYEFGEQIFDIRLSKDKTSMTNWEVAGTSGGMLSIGVGGSITGHGADLMIIDDPIKNRKEAESIAYRERLWGEWQSTLLTRLQPGGAVILVVTRWHEDDLPGRILEEEGSDWEVIRMPAMAEDENDPLGRRPGEALWPEEFDEAWAEEMKREVGEYTWASLYQQRPAPPEGGMFSRGWFETIDIAPQDLRMVRYWDLAASEAAGSSYTVGLLLGKDKDSNFYVLDVQRIQGTPAKVEELVKRTAERDGKEIKIVMEQEPGSSGVNTIKYYNRMLAGYPFFGRKETGSKEVRALPVSAQAQAGHIRLVKAPWNRAFLNELEVFPYGANDDQVDALSGAFNEIVQDAPRIRAKSVGRRR